MCSSRNVSTFPTTSGSTTPPPEASDSDVCDLSLSFITCSLTEGRKLEVNDNTMVILLTKLPEAQCPALCHSVVDGLCGREGPRLADYSATWSLEEWLQLLESLSSFFRLAVGNTSSEEEVLAVLADVSSGHREALLAVLKARQEELCQALLDRTNSISSTTLQDFDWQLKLALSSDKIQSLQTPLLSLSLDVRENGVLRPVVMEMSRDELNGLVSSLEAANKVVLQLK